MVHWLGSLAPIQLFRVRFPCTEPIKNNPFLILFSFRVGSGDRTHYWWRDTGGPFLRLAVVRVLQHEEDGRIFYLGLWSLPQIVYDWASLFHQSGRQGGVPTAWPAPGGGANRDGSPSWRRRPSHYQRSQDAFIESQGINFGLGLVNLLFWLYS